MGAKSRPPYPAAFRAEAVQLVHANGRSLTQAAQDLGIHHETLRAWVKAAGQIASVSGALLFSFLWMTTLHIYSQAGLITLVGHIAKTYGLAWRLPTRGR